MHLLKKKKNDPITKYNFFLLGKFFMMSEFLGNPKGKVGTFFYLSISNLYSLFTYTTAQNYLLLATDFDQYWAKKCNT